MSLLSVSVSIEVITDGRSCFEIKSIKEGAVKINRKTIEKEKGQGGCKWYSQRTNLDISYLFASIL